MQRRRILEASGLAFLSSVAGCVSLGGGSGGDDENLKTVTQGQPVALDGEPVSTTETTTTEQQTQNGTTDKEPPKVSWSEERLQGNRYRVTATFKFSDATTVEVVTIDEDSIATISGKSGETVENTLVGPDTEYGPLTPARGLVVRHQDFPISDYIIGSQEDPASFEHLHGVSGRTWPEEGVLQSDVEQKSYSYKFRGESYTAEIPINKTYYEYYKNRRRVDPYGAYVSDRLDQVQLNKIADLIQGLGKSRGLSDREEVEHAIHFVQHLKYADDKVTTGYNEYPKYPLETLYEKKGDCEDTAILVVSILRAMGHDAVLLIMPGHMAAGVAGVDSLSGTSFERNGRQYYYLETTARGWEVGHIPDDYNPKNIRILPAESHPVLVYDYQIETIAGLQPPTVMGGVMNVGDAAAEDVEMRLVFTTEDETVAQKKVDVGTIKPEKMNSYEATLRPSATEPVRLNTAVFIGQKPHDTSTTGMIKPSREPFSG
jgi:hypothetical protein